MKKSVFRTFMMSNLIILMFAILIALFAFYTYQIEARKQSEKYNMVFLSQLQSTFDEHIKNINGILDNIYSDPSVRSLIFSKANPDIYERYTAVEVKNKLSNLLPIYQYVDSIILVYNNSDLIVTNVSVYRSIDEFLTLSDYAYRDKNDWESLFQNFRNVKYAGNITSKGKNIYTMIKSIPIGASRYSSGYVVINFYYDLLVDSLSNLAGEEKGLIYVSDQQDNVIMSIGNASLKNGLKITDRNEKPNIAYMKINGENYMVYNVYSGETRLNYVFTLLESSLLEKGINGILLLTFAAVITIGFIFCVLAAKYNANPIRKIMDMFAQKNIIAIEGRDTNELEFINKAAFKAMNEYDNIKNEYTRHIPILQSNVILNILKGVMAINDNDELRALGIEFIYEKYSVIIFDFQGDSAKKVIEYNWLNINLRNIIYDMFSASGIIYMCDLDIGRIGAILNIDSDIMDNSGAINKDMENLIEHIKNDYDIIMTVTVGGTTSSPEKISSLYMNAQEAMTYQLFNRPGSFAFYSNIKLNNRFYAYPTDMEGYLVSNLKLGNVENVSNAIQKAFTEINENNDLPEVTSKFFFLDLTKTLLRTVASLGIDIDSVYEKNKYNPVEAVTRSKNIWIMKDLVHRLYIDTATIISERKTKLGKPLIDRIKEYITDNYKNQSLSLNMVADAFNLNSSYLSTYFKKNTGDSFTNYVNTVRLSNAVELLKESDININDIAGMVGYSNSAIFINNFKKMYGMTPGAYRSTPV